MLPEPGNFGRVEHKGGNQAGPARNGKDQGEIVTVPIASLRPGESPRLNGQDKAHITRLAELETRLPPILVDRQTMKVIDGMHRLMVASLKGRETVEVRFFDGSAADAFLWAVKENVAHGLPLSLADRRAATARIILSHQELSDRALGELVGLAARTVASIRRSVASGTSPSDRRVGRDGKVRPLSGVEGRQRVANLLAEQPDASSRVLARRAGVSPATVRDVRQRLARGEAPARSMLGPRGTPADDNAAADTGTAGTPVGESGPARKTGGTGDTAGQEAAVGQLARAIYPPRLAADSPDSMLRAASATALEKLLRDPSLRHSEPGRYLLRLLQLNAAGEQEWPRVLMALPPHCLATVVVLARQYGEMWLGFAQELDERARILDPWASDALGCLARGS